MNPQGKRAIKTIVKVEKKSKHKQQMVYIVDVGLVLTEQKQVNSLVSIISAILIHSKNKDKIP